VRSYYFFFVNPSGHIFGRTVHEAKEDLEALEAAQQLHSPHCVEVWSGARLVARVAPGGAAEIGTSRAATDDPVQRSHTG
jgi:hypothetical protein